MKKQNKRRGSAMAMVLLTATGMGIMAAAALAMTGSVSSRESKKHESREDQSIISGAEAFAKSDLISRNIRLGDTKAYRVGSTNVNVSILDNHSRILNTVRMRFSAVGNGHDLAAERVISLPKLIATSFFSYGIYSNSGFTWATGSKVTGSVYFRNSITVQGAGGQVTKDFKTSSMYNPTGILNVGGAIMTGLTPLQWPSLDTGRYLASATTVLQGNQTLNGYTFPTENALVVVNGNLNLGGSQISGKGTIYVTGLVTVSGSVRASTGSKFAIITPNGISFNVNSGGMTQIDGYWFSGQTMQVSGGLTVSGSLVANQFSGSKPVVVTWDRWMMEEPETAESMFAPGMWPSRQP